MTIDSKTKDIKPDQTKTRSPSMTKSDEVSEDEKKLFLQNKIIQAEAISAVEARDRLAVDQANVPDNGD